MQSQVKRQQHVDELLPPVLQQKDPTNDSLSPSSFARCTDQYQSDKLLAQIRSGVQLRHVIPNDHKQCTKMLYDKACEKEENNINEKEVKLETEKTIDIGNILLNAMHKRRLLMRFG
uniref:WH2 domain-containing protein n=1 Tax=Wuchereria bancrofti TaxID=6293 RepID=A0AAF5Q4L6_WUCBA